jgi:serralysin
VEAAGEGNDLVYATTSYTLAAGSEIEILSAGDMAGTASTDLGGNELDNVLWGNAGLNTLSGYGGNDSLHGFGGNDGLLGGEGHDYLDGGDGEDSLHGEAGQDILAGGAGNDFLSGGDGADVMYGGGGNDTYIADSGDYIVEAAGQGVDIVYATGNFALSAGQEIEALYGNGLANTLQGNELANMLDGKDGNDTLTGGAGADMFAFTTALGAGNIDTVSGFEHGADRIGLSASIFAAAGGPGTLGANAFVTGAAAADGDDRIIYNSTTGALLYDADGTGGASSAVQFATLATGLNLTASDFQVI